MAKIELVGYKIFEDEMRDRYWGWGGEATNLSLYLLRMKDHLMDIREKKGDEEFFANIRNCVAGCRQKWKLMNKVCILYFVLLSISLISFPLIFSFFLLLSFFLD